MKAERFLEALGEIDEKYIEEARYNTMKKRFNFKPIIAVAACAAIALAAIPVVNNFVNATPAVQGTTGAQNTPTESRFKVYEYSIMDEDFGNHEIDSPWLDRSVSYKDSKKTGTTKKMVFNSLEVETTYVMTHTATDFKKARDKYEGYIDGRKIAFEIDTETGKTIDFLLHPNENYTGKKLTRDELYEAALKFFADSGYVDDIENYKLISETKSDEVTGYRFRFARFVDGIETSDSILIGVRWDGEIGMTKSTNLGELKDFDASSIDMDEFYNEVEKKLKNIYGDMYVGFEKDGVKISKLIDGTYVFEYIPTVQIKHPSTNKITRASAALLITMD